MEEIPPQIPDRTTAEDYFYHAYDFVGSKIFKRSENYIGDSNKRFYSLVKDLKGLFVEAKRKDLKPKNPPLDPSTGFGRRILALQFGKNPEKTVLFSGGIHGREWMAVEMPYLIAEYLIKNYPDPDGENALNEEQKVIKKLLDNRCIVVMPMLNPDGHNHSVTDYFLWRGNRNKPDVAAYKEWASRNVYPYYKVTDEEDASISYDVKQYKKIKNRSVNFLESQIQIGIDLNRNFEHKYWGYETYIGDISQTFGAPTKTNLRLGGGVYFGSSPNSENETQAITSYLNSLNNNGRILASIDYHTYGQFIIYPALMPNIGNYLSSLITNTKQPEYKVGNTAKLLYPAFASMMDYCHETHKISAYTIELDPAQLPPHDPKNQSLPDYQDAVFNLFKPDRTKIQDVFEKNIRGALALISSAGETFKKQYFTQFANWDVFGRGNQLPEKSIK